jgi:predicted nucleic acid-binding Zn ribbon protein
VRPAKPARAARDEPSRLADLLGEVVNDQGWDERLAAQRVFTDWAGIVGPEVAQHSEVIAFDDGVVEVRTDSTAWATQLRLLAPRIVAKLNELMGDGSVLRIVVRGPQAPSWKKGPRSIRGARGPRDTYG